MTQSLETRETLPEVTKHLLLHSGTLEPSGVTQQGKNANNMAQAEHACEAITTERGEAG